MYEGGYFFCPMSVFAEIEPLPIPDFVPEEWCEVTI